MGKLLVPNLLKRDQTAEERSLCPDAFCSHGRKHTTGSNRTTYFPTMCGTSFSFSQMLSIGSSPATTASNSFCSRRSYPMVQYASASLDLPRRRREPFLAYTLRWPCPLRHWTHTSGRAGQARGNFWELFSAAFSKSKIAAWSHVLRGLASKGWVRKSSPGCPDRITSATG